MKRTRLFRFLAGALTVLLCAALCCSVLLLYRQGLDRRAASGSLTAPIFTREAAAQRLLWLSPLAVLWAASLLMAAVSGASDAGEKRRAGSQEDLGHPLSRIGIPDAKNKRLLRLALYVLAAGLTAGGILNGGLHDVLVKAIHICTECIGLG